jgi:predicted nucleic acid-binding protein
VSYVIDTNICVAYLNEQDAALRAQLERTEPDDLELCSIVKGELLTAPESSDVTVPFRCPVRIAGRGPKGHPEALDPWS